MSSSASAGSSAAGSGGCAFKSVCDRHEAAIQPDHHGSVHHNDQLPLLGLALVMIGGGLIQHFGGILRLPFPYTMLLLMYGMALGLWILFDPAFTLQPGMRAGEHAWGDAILQCNVTEYVPNDLNVRIS